MGGGWLGGPAQPTSWRNIRLFTIVWLRLVMGTRLARQARPGHLILCLLFNIWQEPGLGLAGAWDDRLEVMMLDSEETISYLLSPIYYLALHLSSPLCQSPAHTPELSQSSLPVQSSHQIFLLGLIFLENPWDLWWSHGWPDWSGERRERAEMLIINYRPTSDRRSPTNQSKNRTDTVRTVHSVGGN